MGIEIRGMDNLQRRLNNTVDTGKITECMNQAVLLVHRQAKELAPVDTGNLRASIHPKVVTQGKNVIGKVFTNVNYAPYVEFGTGAKGNGTYPNPNVVLSYRSTPWTYTPDGENFYKTSGQVAQPFLYPAIKLNKKRINAMFKNLMQNNLQGGN